MSNSTTAGSTVRIPREILEVLRDYLSRATRHLADTAGIEAQAIAGDGEGALIAMEEAWARADTLTRLWGPTGERPAMPGRSRAALRPCPVGAERLREALGGGDEVIG